MGRKVITLEQRFEKYVIRRPGCWGWKAYHSPTGYAITSYPRERRPLAVHRLSYMLANNLTEIPKGLLVRHKCNNRACINPKHLLLGTYKDNHDDAVRSGRWTRGHKQGQTSLYAKDIRRIRAMRKRNMSLSDIAVKFGVGKTAICNITTGRNWAWVK